MSSCAHSEVSSLCSNTYPEMFEARLEQASTLKKLLESVKEIIDQGNFDCSSDGMSLQVRCKHTVLISGLGVFKMCVSNEKLLCFEVVSQFFWSE